MLDPPSFSCREYANFLESTYSDVGQTRLLLWLLTLLLLSRLGPERQRDVGGLHRLPYYTHRSIADGITPLHTLSRRSEAHLPLILSYVPPCRQLRPSLETYSDIRHAHVIQHHLTYPASARD